MQFFFLIFGLIGTNEPRGCLGDSVCNQRRSAPCVASRRVGHTSACGFHIRFLSLITSPPTMTIYRSPIPDVAAPEEPLFAFLFGRRADRKIPDSTPAFIDGPTGRTVDRSELRTASLSLGWGLRNEFAKLGGVEITKGDTVMVFSPNSFAWPFALFGSLAAGLKMTLANASYTPAELGHQWKDSNAKAVFTHPALVPTVLTMLEASGIDKEESRKRIIIMGVGDRNATAQGFVHMDDLLEKGVLCMADRSNRPSLDETALICYSSGTTGKPKGVEVRASASSNNLTFHPKFRLSRRIRTSFPTAS